MLATLPPPTVPTEGAVPIHTSGTLSSCRRVHFYQQPQFGVIQDHHWWRIEQAHGLEHPGRVALFGYNPYYARVDGHNYQIDRSTMVLRPLDRPEDCVHGPARVAAVGSHNAAYTWHYTRHTTSAGWRAIWQRLHALVPKVVLMAPSQFQAAWPGIAGLRPLACPVVMTSEMLDDVTRDLAVTLFSRVIDKMRCWDGGLGFFECREGRRHVYDDLAYVERVDGTLVSTDFFNFISPFLRYANSDDGVVADGSCACGVYGRYFVAFEGRVCQRIVLDGRPISGRAVTEDMMRFLTYGYLPSVRATEAFRQRHPAHLLGDMHVRWRLRQHADGDFEFQYAGALTDAQVGYLGEGVRFVVLRVGDLPAGGPDVPSRHGLSVVRCDSLGDALKSLSVISEYAGDG